MSQQQQSFCRIIKPSENMFTKRQIKGAQYIDILDKVKRIVYYQKENHITQGLKGFVFHGTVGIGKTVCSKAIANDLGATLLFIDGADIARKFYGESESQIARIFDEAKKHGFVVILIDDAESVFPTRDWQKSESWHFAQNNVFFHQLDNIDTSKIVVILTTNRFDLIDKAVKDRLHCIEFPMPSKETLREIAEYKCGQLKMKPESIYALIDKDGLSSVRELEKAITILYIDEIIRSA